MLDLVAPIIPGRSAAGYQIGLPIEVVPAEELARFQRIPLCDCLGKPTMVRFESEPVRLWVDLEGHIDQIGVRNGYRGKLLEQIGLGMTIADLERLTGPVAEDEEDTLTIFGIRGFGFEVEVSPPWKPEHLPDGYPDFAAAGWQSARLEELFVFQIQEIQYFPWIFALPHVPKEALHTLPEDALISVPPALLVQLSEEVLVNLPIGVVQHFPDEVLTQVLPRLPEQLRSQLSSAP